MLSGYAGKIAWIDLTEGTIRIEDSEEDLARKYLEGKSLGAYLPYKHFKPRIDPFDPVILIFMTGPLTYVIWGRSLLYRFHLSIT